MLINNKAYKMKTNYNMHQEIHINDDKNMTNIETT